MPHYQEWMRRTIAGGPRLGQGPELWADLSAHPATPRLQSLAQTHGRSLDSSDATYYLTRSLLLDVIHAAGGVEYTVEKLLDALDVVQQWSDASPLVGPAPVKYEVAPERWDVSFEVSNLVVWARILRDRLQDDTQRKGVKIGLLPALAAGELKDQVQGFYNELANWVEAETYLAGYTLHIGRLHGGTPVLQREPDGHVRFLLPDRPGSRVWSWEELTYRQNRDARSVAVDLLQRIERFMDGLLSSLELHAS
jgi:hypothetical protein